MATQDLGGHFTFNPQNVDSAIPWRAVLDQSAQQVESLFQVLRPP
jgi:hypothetical protein